PCVSQPVIYGALNPFNDLKRVIKSFKIWLSACPICKSPLAYGGPSCNINNGLSLVRFNPWPYTSSFSHFSRRIGSLFGRFPLIGNFVFCIYNVGLYSTNNFSLIIISKIYFKHKKSPHNSLVKGREDSRYHPYKFTYSEFLILFVT